MSAWTQLADVLGADVYAAHSLCLSNDWWLINLYIAANSVVFLSYTVIAGVLSWTFLVDKAIRINLTGRPGVLFAAFIFCCGCTHCSEVLLLFAGVYRLDIMVVVVTAVVSAVTALHVAGEKLEAVALQRKRRAVGQTRSGP